jgi:MFS family permease
MLSSISPLGERARASRWWLTTTAYMAGSVAGGLAVGWLAAALGSLVPATWRSSPAGLLLLAVLLLLGLALDLGTGGLALPSWRRQVDEQWLTRYRGWVYGLGFGLQLGLGVVTIVTSATTYAAVLLAAWSGHLGVGVAIGGTFGLLRAVPSLGLRRVTDRDALHRVFARVESWANPADIIARVALAAVATTLVATAVGS